MLSAVASRLAQAIVLCVDEKSQIQALDRSQPMLPMRPNQVEGFFALLTDKKIGRGVYRSVAALGTDIASFIERHNADPEPFRWTKSADDMLASIERFRHYNALVQYDTILSTFYMVAPYTSSFSSRKSKY